MTDKRYANRRFGGMHSITFTDSKQCLHNNGWYVFVSFWLFKKRVFVCSDCGEVQRG